MSINWTHYRWKIIGLYEEDHGIINNKFYDPNYDEKFKYGRETKWFNATEPIWVTAEREGKKSGAYMWTGQSICWQAKCSCLTMLVATILPISLWFRVSGVQQAKTTPVIVTHLTLAKIYGTPHHRQIKLLLTIKAIAQIPLLLLSRVYIKVYFMISALWHKKKTYFNAFGT